MMTDWYNVPEIESLIKKPVWISGILKLYIQVDDWFTIRHYREHTNAITGELEIELREEKKEVFLSGFFEIQFPSKQSLIYGNNRIEFMCLVYPTEHNQFNSSYDLEKGLGFGDFGNDGFLFDGLLENPDQRDLWPVFASLDDLEKFCLFNKIPNYRDRISELKASNNNLESYSKPLCHSPEVGMILTTYSELSPIKSTTQSEIDDLKFQLKESKAEIEKLQKEIIDQSKTVKAHVLNPVIGTVRALAMALIGEPNLPEKVPPVTVRKILDAISEIPDAPTTEKTLTKHLTKL
jgi:hypothetical protein